MLTAQQLVEYNINWQPSPAMIAWAQNFIRIMKNGSTWAVPMNGSVYTFDHTNKTLWLDVGETDDVFLRNKIVFGKLGWQVLQRHAQN